MGSLNVRNAPDVEDFYKGDDAEDPTSTSDAQVDFADLPKGVSVTLEDVPSTSNAPQLAGFQQKLKDLLPDQLDR